MIWVPGHLSNSGADTLIDDKGTSRCLASAHGSLFDGAAEGSVAGLQREEVPHARGTSNGKEGDNYDKLHFVLKFYLIITR